MISIANIIRALYNVLVILSQRPSITDSRTDGASSTTVHESVNACTLAATQIVQILRDYSQHFRIDSAPYLLIYAGYISATIHANVVAQKGPTSGSFQCLRLCRNILRKNERLYSAATKAGTNLDKLITRMGISLVEDNREMTDSVMDMSDSENPFPNSSLMPSENAGHCDEPYLFTSTCELSDLDLEAIADGFQFDGDFNHLMRPLGE